MLTAGGPAYSLTRSLTDVGRAWTLLARLQVKFDRRAFLQMIEVKALKRAAVEKQFLPIVCLDKPESPVLDQFLDSTVHGDLEA